jgi:hypothetical protein
MTKDEGRRNWVHSNRGNGVSKFDYWFSKSRWARFQVIRALWSAGQLLPAPI